VATLLVAAMAARRKPAENAFLALAVMCVAGYAAQMSFPYRAARESTGSRDLAKSLRADAAARKVRVAVSEDAESILRYYRWRYRQGNWDPIERLRADATFDYYVLTPRDAAIVKQRGLRVLYRDAGLILAR
jgi:hypothetical protein